jgi:hypothetical protein
MDLVEKAAARGADSFGARPAMAEYLHKLIPDSEIHLRKGATCRFSPTMRRRS